MSDNVRIWWDEEYGCYDIGVLSEDATVGDVERAGNLIFTGAAARRRYGSSCEGCCICCGGRIPLTPGDISRMIKAGLGVGLSLKGWLDCYGRVEDLGPCLDITLKCCDDDICSLWDRKKAICSLYQARPFVCRMYICAPFSRRLEEVRSQIVNYGEDLLGEMILKGDFNGGDEFAEIPLRNICSKELWYCLKDI